MAEHCLKTWPSYFQAILDNRKRFEARKFDRDFALGDTLRLIEWQPYGGVGDRGWPTGRALTCQVVYLLHGAFGIPTDLCIMSIAGVKLVEEEGA